MNIMCKLFGHKDRTIMEVNYTKSTCGVFTRCERCRTEDYSEFTTFNIIMPTKKEG